MPKHDAIRQDPRICVGTLAATLETERGIHPKEVPGERNPTENMNRKGHNWIHGLRTVNPHEIRGPTGVVVVETHLDHSLAW